MPEPETFTVDAVVRDYHIQHGDPHLCSSCPMAQAVLDAIRPTNLIPVVCKDRVDLVDWRGELVYRAGMTKKGYRFITRFDGGAKVQPDTFRFRFRRVN